MSKAKSVPKTPTPPVEADAQPYPKLRTTAGGVSEMPPIDEVLERLRLKDTWEGEPGRYYASGLMQCFRAAWFDGHKVPCDHDLPPRECESCRFDVGIAKPGNATEDYLRRMVAEVLNYGKEGVVLNDLRFSHAIPVEWEDEDENGNVEEHDEVAVLIAKADMTILGDNLRVLAQFEVKSPVYTFKKALSETAKKYGRRVPLAVAGVEDPENPGGVMSVHQLVQLAVTSHLLALQGNPPGMSILLTISRTNYRDHLEVLLKPEQSQHLFDLACWWVQENHINLQYDEPPAPTYFTTWHCRYCNWAKRCADINEATGEERIMHPVMTGLNQRLKQAVPFEAPEA